MNDSRQQKKQRQFKHITERERYAIETMLKLGKSKAEIAEEIGKSRSTIYAEIRRGTVKQLKSDLTETSIYLADYAQRDYDLKKHEKGRYLKIGNDMEFVRFVENKIKNERYSPVATLQALKEKRDIRTNVCHRTLYRYIHSGIFLNISSGDLPYRVSKKQEKERKNIALKNTKGNSIENRPKYIGKRERIGHWEMDTVYSGKGKGKDCLLVLTERKTRYEEIYHMKSRTQEEVVRVLDDIENKIGLPTFIRRYKTITCDNGVEFLNSYGTERSITTPDTKRTLLYYCHPFASCERGSNENQNKLIRRWIPKGESIAEYKDKIPYIQEWINNYPRKMFAGKSTIEYIHSLPFSERSEIIPIK